MKLNEELKAERKEASSVSSEYKVAHVDSRLSSVKQDSFDQSLYATVSEDEWESLIDSMEIDPNIPVLADEALKRESIYPN